MSHDREQEIRDTFVPCWHVTDLAFEGQMLQAHSAVTDLLAALDAERARCVVLQQERDDYEQRYDAALDSYNSELQDRLALGGELAELERERAGLLARAEQAERDLKTQEGLTLARVRQREEALARVASLEQALTEIEGHAECLDDLEDGALILQLARVALAGPGDPEEPKCYCGDLTWTVRRYGRVTHKQGCPARTDPWSQSDPHADKAEEPLCPVGQGPTRPTGPGERRCVGGCYWPQGEEQEEER